MTIRPASTPRARALSSEKYLRRRCCRRGSSAARVPRGRGALRPGRKLALDSLSSGPNIRTILDQPRHVVDVEAPRTRAGRPGGGRRREGSMPKRAFPFLLFLVSLLASPDRSAAQSLSGRIVGTVRDGTGAVVRDASISLAQPETGVV